ncbi:ATP-binding cassette domain-containing protein [Streptomyces sp. NBRC 109706]|uniref:ABC transporter ATP-binding protein n=1 Tax=Streptomyces sp. NBRC 109706 TaxID=1550035 RepID=UPI000786738D|nr:ATP-binding cassette domain-containing protein [Streptomyces sp. NBRC 109706]
MSLIETRGLTKSYRQPDKAPGLAGSVRHLFNRRFTERVVVDHVDLDIEEGESVAYVGANGAGKSTTVKMLSGILVPTSGEVRIKGLVPHRERMAVAQHIGVLFGQRTQLWWDLTVRDSLDVLRDIYGIAPDTYRRRLAYFDEVLELGRMLPVVARRLSLGERMRADIAAALLHSPSVVYLDEPTIGLDVAVKHRLRQFLRELTDDGTALMLTSHDLADIEGICRRLVIIDKGRIIFDGALRHLMDTHARDRILHIETAGPADLDALRVALDRAVVSEGDAPHRFRIRFDRFTTTAGQVVAAVNSVVEIVDFSVDEPAIEDVIRRVYAGEVDVQGAVGGAAQGVVDAEAGHG